MNYNTYIQTGMYHKIKKDLASLKELIQIDRNPYYNSYIDPDLRELFKTDEILLHIEILSQSHKEISCEKWLNLAHWATYFNHIEVFKAMIKSTNRDDYHKYLTKMILFAIFVGNNKLCTESLNTIYELCEGDREFEDKCIYVLMCNFPNISKKMDNHQCLAIMDSKLFQPQYRDSYYVFDQNIINNEYIFFTIYKRFYMGNLGVPGHIRNKFFQHISHLDMCIDILN